ncbi:XRE family transcriptional regulator [Rhodococcus erythropolis]|uniref:helix-turn-helix domain-containing protein n=1 Tax=Rhodococcus erythropolis TaxID=1833 RepID=UPI0024BAEE33|nr:XRE family transcriptional regulator [Rhodococcus erythropolis]MDJ0403980.1 XRE family transcriptional regulator [Rhodococcus erythropolis]
MSNPHASVWDAISDTPADAEIMKAKSAIMIAIRKHIQSKGWTQKEAATAFGVTQPRISDLTKGKIDKFRVDTLMSMAAAAGLHVEVRVLETA